MAISSNSLSLSIIIVSWNTAHSTLECIKTIQTYLKAINPEIIVVDNASSDSTIGLLKSIKNIVIIKNQKNLGFSKACNQGAFLAKNNFLLFLNSDIKLIDKSIIDMLKYFSSESNIGVIGPEFLNPDLTPQASVFPLQTPLNALKEFWLSIPSYSKYLPPLDKPVSVWSISGGALMIKKSFFKQIGGWNEKYFFYFEDLDLCRKVHQAKKTVVFYPKCQVIHYHGLSGRNLVSAGNQWRRLIPSSIKYHGFLKHYLIFLIIWSGQKWQKIKKLF